MDILTLNDLCCETLEGATAEVARRKKLPDGQFMIHRIVDSPYGGYRITSILADVYADMLAEGIPLRFGDRRRYRKKASAG